MMKTLKKKSEIQKQKNGPVLTDWMGTGLEAGDLRFEDWNPPFNNELLDVILFGTPKSWQKEMEQQGCDPMGQPLHEVVDFLENIKASEDFEVTKETKKKNTFGKSKGSSSSGELHFMLHGKGNHAVEDCVKLKAESKRFKSNSSGKKSSGGKSSKDKSWDDKASKATAKAKSDLAATNKSAPKLACHLTWTGPSEIPLASSGCLITLSGSAVCWSQASIHCHRTCV